MSSLEAIKEEIEVNLVCELKDAATNMVFGKGNPQADIMFIGEAPGEKEDLEGLPFVGAAGKQLDKLLNHIGLSLDDVYIANILKYRPPNNRDPKPEEIANHTPYLIKQIQAIKPRVLVTLGNFSSKFVLAGFSVEGMKDIPGMSEIHGTVHKVNEFHVMPIYHPAAQLYKPPLRFVLQKDFEKLADFLGIKTKEKSTGLDQWI